MQVILHLQQVFLGWIIYKFELNIKLKIVLSKGEQLYLNHIGQGTNENGVLRVDIEVEGEVPMTNSEVDIRIDPLEGTLSFFFILFSYILYIINYYSYSDNVRYIVISQGTQLLFCQRRV